MIIYNEFEQRSLEWFEIKWAKIGGTLSKGLHVNSDTLFIDILSQRIEDFEVEESFTSAAMQNGIDSEIFAQEYLEKYTGLKFTNPSWLQSEENELLGISPDGITEDLTIACEFKAFARKQHLRCLLTQEIPKENIDQIIHYFTVNNKLEKLYFLSFRPESPKHFIKEITLDSIINTGTEKKPILKPIKEMVTKSKESAKALLERLIYAEKQLKSF